MGAGAHREPAGPAVVDRGPDGSAGAGVAPAAADREAAAGGLRRRSRDVRDGRDEEFLQEEYRENGERPEQKLCVLGIPPVKSPGFKGSSRAEMPSVAMIRTCWQSLAFFWRAEAGRLSYDAGR